MDMNIFRIFHLRLRNHYYILMGILLFWVINWAFLKLGLDWDNDLLDIHLMYILINTSPIYILIKEINKDSIIRYFYFLSVGIVRNSIKNFHFFHNPVATPLPHISYRVAFLIKKSRDFNTEIFFISFN